MLKYLTSDRYVTFYRANTGYCRPVVCIQADFYYYESYSFFHLFADFCHVVTYIISGAFFRVRAALYHVRPMNRV